MQSHYTCLLTAFDLALLTRCITLKYRLNLAFFINVMVYGKYNSCCINWTSKTTVVQLYKQHNFFGKLRPSVWIEMTMPKFAPVCTLVSIPTYVFIASFTYVSNMNKLDFVYYTSIYFFMSRTEKDLCCNFYFWCIIHKK